MKETSGSSFYKIIKFHRHTGKTHSVSLTSNRVVQVTHSILIWFNLQLGFRRAMWHDLKSLSLSSSDGTVISKDNQYRVNIQDKDKED